MVMLSGRFPSWFSPSPQVLEPEMLMVSGVWLLVMIKPVEASPVITVS